MFFKRDVKMLKLQKKRKDRGIRGAIYLLTIRLLLSQVLHALVQF
jgi:hypothetical protein